LLVTAKEYRKLRAISDAGTQASGVLFKKPDPFLKARRRRARKMTFARVLLFSCAFVFIFVGAGFLLIPLQSAQVLEISLPTAMARTDVRATYGGLELGFGVLLVLCALRREWIRPGLWALALSTGGFAVGRLTGLLVEGTINSFMLAFLVIEIVVTLLAVFVLRRRGTEWAGALARNERVARTISVGTRKKEPKLSSIFHLRASLSIRARAARAPKNPSSFPPAMLIISGVGRFMSGEDFQEEPVLAAVKPLNNVDSFADGAESPGNLPEHSTKRPWPASAAQTGVRVSDADNLTVSAPSGSSLSHSLQGNGQPGRR
jgi:hypothetical protein